jgi:hypothetical protein
MAATPQGAWRRNRLETNTLFNGKVRPPGLGIAEAASRLPGLLTGQYCHGALCLAAASQGGRQRHPVPEMARLRA